ncbi:MAG: hypothetical protein JW384_04143 [Nitrosomonadaceae bacterium]|nr:hypothetical protein [Nitrosomonadaceae bacterium]
MIWEKIGFFKVPQGRYPWMHSHAQLPTALPLGGQRVRVLFASRTAESRSHIAFADLIFKSNPDRFEVERVSAEPVLLPGPIGFFDEHGVYPSCVVQHDGRYYLYYIGWNQGVEAPLFYAAIGLAISDDGLVFRKHSPAPLLSRSEFDPCLVTSPHVYVEDGHWHMTYVSGIGWNRGAGGKLYSRYHIKSAQADDPFNWRRKGCVAIDFAAGETNLARPCVVKSSSGWYQMWFSYAHSGAGKYRIGYAESKDGIIWDRKDHLSGIGLDNEYAREAICYPCVFTLGTETYMLYNGDCFGEAGFGVAKQVGSRRA